MVANTKKFAGVAGKTVEFITSGVDLDGQPLIDIQFTDGTALDIVVQAPTLNLSAEWSRVRDGNLSPLRRKIFL